MKRLLSLFDYTGNWSEPYRAAGWEVTQVDLALGQDILTWDYQQFSPDHFNGILAAVPCTAYALSGATYWKKKDADGTTEQFNRLTRKTLEIINYFRPSLQFWVIENPVGRIAQCVPELAKFRLYAFNPCDFGEAYTKKTVLYGEFAPWLIHRPVKPFTPKKGHHSMDAYYLQGKNNIRFQDRAALRSATPKGFSLAFFEANH
jgi:hypothetical protein